MHLRILVACHNRRTLTTRVVRTALHAAEVSNVPAIIYLLDDGSSDGTSDAVREIAPTARIVHGDGTYFWAKSMSDIERVALSEASAEDLIVWLNDDVKVDADAFVRALPFVRANGLQSVIVCGTREPATGSVSYAGFNRHGLHPLSLRVIEPLPNSPVPIDTFNGNFVIVPEIVARSVGGIDGEFSHALADIDYGFRCHAAGVDVYLAPGTFGECPRNPPSPPTSVLREWRQFTGVKGGGNFASSRRILRKRNPLTWSAFLGATYALWWLRLLTRGRRS
ncbi:glycosyltransferase family 2 protein [Microbacterium endophyticum]|nr:glycosyltransferase [Microbacterium endophyticum]